MDCLDRTNVIQTAFCREVLQSAVSGSIPFFSVYICTTHCDAIPIITVTMCDMYCICHNVIVL